MIDIYETPPSIVIHQKLNLGTSPRAVIGLKIILSKVLIRKKCYQSFSNKRKVDFLIEQQEGHSRPVKA